MKAGSTRRLLYYVRPYWVQAGLSLACLFLAIGFGAVTPMLTRYLVDRAIIGGEWSLLLPMVLGIVVFTLFRVIALYGMGSLREWVGQRVSVDLRKQLYGKLQSLSYAYYDQAQTGQLMSRLTGDVESTRVFLSFALVDLVNALVTFVFVFWILAQMDWRLTLVSLGTTPLLLMEVLRIHRRLGPAWSGVHQQNAKLNTVLQEAVTGVRVVKAFAREKHTMEQFERENQALKGKHMSLNRLWSYSFPYMDALTSLSWTLMVWYGAVGVINGRITPGVLVAFNGYLWSLIWPIRHLGWIVNVMGQARTAGDRIFEIIDERVAVEPNPSPVKPEKICGEIVFDKVSFAYKGFAAIKDVSFRVQPGQTVALVGQTGSGKSSIINLLLRFYDPQEGRIQVDGVDLRDLDLGVWRQSVGIVPQETFLFSASLGENIAYGRWDATPQEIRQAAEDAQAWEFISKLENGLDTLVGERGLGLSGGQKQRIAIARALVMSPAVLIFDDATSAVDTETEQAIQTALSRRMQGLTTFLVSQRFSAIRQADLILVLHGGRLVEQGTHQELLALNGHYAQSYRQQLQAERGESLAQGE